MDREQGDTGESIGSSVLKYPEPKPPGPKSPNDASVVANRIPTFHASAKAPFLAAAQEESDLTRVKASWCWEQYNRTQPWSITMSPRKVSPTLSFKEFANHLSSNLDAFHCKDFTLPFKSLTTGCWCWQIVMMLLVCATFKLHNKGDKVTFWSTKTTMLSGKNRKLLVATAVALPLLYIVDTWTVVTWSFGVTTVIGFVRASLCAGPGASPEDHGRLNSMPFAS
ncbi:hypothetical protein MRX96_015785 [Rhipicephalus microplus]